MAEKKKEEKEEKPEKAAAGDKMKLIIFAAAGVVLLAAIGAGSYYLGTRKAPSPAPPEGATGSAATGHEEKSEAGGHAEKPSGPMVEIAEFIINLLDKDTNHFLKAAFVLEVDSEKTAAELKEKMPKIRDAILLIASNKTFAELRDLQGKMQLRAEIAGHLNTILGKGKVAHIYITNFVIQ